VVPLTRGHGLGVGVTSYNGGVFMGLNADRDAIGDLDLLASEVQSATEMLTDTVRGSRGRGRGRLRAAGSPR
jgi:hypothetical protein